MSVSPQYMAALRAASGLTGNNSALGSTFGGAGNSLGILSGLQRGGFGGYAGAATNAAQLANRWLHDPSLNQGAGALSNITGIYSGLQQGGVGGYGRAAINAAKLGSTTGALPAAFGQYAGYLGAPLALYNFGKNWKSGATGSDALSGAQTGAEIGSIIPGLGTVVGGLIGGAAGALSSAFGGGAVDPETHAVQNLIDYAGAHPGQGALAAAHVDNPYLQLAGLMDRHQSTLPMYQQYGRMGEQKFTNDLISRVQADEAKGLKDPNQIYAQDVAPWVAGMGSGWKNVGQAYTDTTQGLVKDMVDQVASGAYQQNFKAIGGDNPWAAPAPSSNPHPATQPTTFGNMRSFAAEGGQMKKKRSALQSLYKGPSFSERHYDDGGSVDYFSDPTLGVNDFTTPPLQDLSGSMDQSNPFSDINQELGDTGNIINAQNDPYAYGVGPGQNNSGGSSGGSPQGALSQLVQNHPSLQYAALLPLLSSLFGGSGGAKAPALPPGFSPGAISTMGAPTSMRTQAQMDPNTDWYTYGQHPEKQFYNNNQLPFIPGYSPSSAAPQGAAPSGAPTTNMQPLAGMQPRAVMAHGGALAQTFDSGAGDTYVHDQGHGDGTSDPIDAKLSPGEYVMDAGTVAALGNGSNDAGARQLDQLRQRVRKHAGRQMAKGKQFMKAKAPEKYLKKTGTGD